MTRYELFTRIDEGGSFISCRSGCHGLLTRGADCQRLNICCYTPTEQHYNALSVLSGDAGGSEGSLCVLHREQFAHQEKSSW